MPKFRYLPMMRSRAGEATALANLTDPAKDRMLPVIHLVHVPPPTFGATVGDAWTGRPMALDGTFQTDITGSPQSFTNMFDQIGRKKVALIPSIEYNATPPYLAAVQRVRNRYAPGVVVKAKPNQLNDVANWVAIQGWSQNEVDLVVTLTQVGGYDPGMLEPVVIQAIISNTPNPSPWRSIALSSSAAPQDHGGLVTGRNVVPRLEWRIWRGVSGKIPFRLDFADYLTLTPDLADPPGYVMARATVSVRYTIDDNWIILKGSPTTGRTGQAMGAQYRSHARTLVADPNFGGLTGCWADGRIQQIAAGASTSGGRPQWASYAANRHLSFISDRLP